MAVGVGSIPARAGEPGRRRGSCRRRSVYPRACGGTSRRAGARAPARGLSPRVRGNRVNDDHVAHPDGSIPARAGEPNAQTNFTNSPKVYPRACGGTQRANQFHQFAKGLSPRVRGNPFVVNRGGGWPGSIPARAGEPLRCQPWWRLAGVYPRACGGTPSLSTVVAAGRGLSPRVRGNPFVVNRGGGWPGSIPARAGEPLRCQPWWRLAGVYPRACGGTPSLSTVVAAGRGLSPRVRGNPFVVNRGGGWPGSIPARAGEPLRCQPWWRLAGVYPRACGGTSPGPC